MANPVPVTTDTLVSECRQIWNRIRCGVGTYAVYYYEWEDAYNTLKIEDLNSKFLEWVEKEMEDAGGVLVGYYTKDVKVADLRDDMKVAREEPHEEEV